MHLCENLVDVNPTQRVRVGPSGELLTPRGDRMQDTNDLIPTFGGSRAFEDAGSSSCDRGDPSDDDLIDPLNLVQSEVTLMKKRRFDTPLATVNALLLPILLAISDDAIWT